MANATARDDLAQLFNDDLLGMDAGVGDAAEEKARERATPCSRTSGAGTGRDARPERRGEGCAHSWGPIGVLGGGNPRGSDRRGHGRGGTRVGGVVPGPRAPERGRRPAGGTARIATGVTA